MKKFSPSLNKLVNILNDGKFHSGTELGQSLKISRAAVWKAIKQLIDYGVDIQSVHGKGYRLAEPLLLLDESLLKETIAAAISEKIELFTSIPSTQDYVKQLEKKDCRNKLCIAEFQSKARGRMGRNWYSGFGRNICLTYLWHTEKDVSELGGLSLVVGLAIIETIKASNIEIPLKIKWPNDIICHDKKLAGILIELSTEMHTCSQVMIGIGINVNMSDKEPTEINQAWTSLQKETNNIFDRSKLISQLMQTLYQFLQLFTQHGLAHFIPLWQQYDYLAEKSISLVIGDTVITGMVKGITAQGLLELKLADGQVKLFSSGEASIQKK
jgi:BirA family biotin operon repressor/biotin-[acetyl-CoA-carboxylase] ligase